MIGEVDCGTDVRPTKRAQGTRLCEQRALDTVFFRQETRQAEFECALIIDITALRIEAASLNNFPSFRIDYADNLSRADACDVKPAERAATPEEAIVDPNALIVLQWENVSA